jgi:transcriptional regulator with XRE-family HTH domain
LATFDFTTIIMYDNSMNDTVPVHEQLRKQRFARGYSLSRLARLADTSPATLSRYENGWTRFEMATLRKLATALGCELRIELHPVPSRSHGPATVQDVVRRLRRLSWDVELDESVLLNHQRWIVERVLEYGNLSDIDVLVSFLGRREFLDTVSRARLSPRTREFWNRLLEREGMQCTRKSCPGMHQES